MLNENFRQFFSFVKINQNIKENNHKKKKNKKKTVGGKFFCLSEEFLFSKHVEKFSASKNIFEKECFLLL